MTNDSGTGITPRGACRAARLRIAVELGQWFTREQLAYVLALALSAGEAERQADEIRAWGRGFRAGAEHVAELELDALARGLAEQPFSEIVLRREGYRRTARRKADMAAGVPWRTDHPGGPVAEWVIGDRIADEVVA